MTKKLLIGLTLGLSLMTSNALADDAKARAIMEKVDARDDGKTIEQDMMMILIDKNRQKKNQRYEIIFQRFWSRRTSNDVF